MGWKEERELKRREDGRGWNRRRDEAEGRIGKGRDLQNEGCN